MSILQFFFKKKNCPSYILYLNPQLNDRIDLSPKKKKNDRIDSSIFKHNHNKYL